MNGRLTLVALAVGVAAAGLASGAGVQPSSTPLTPNPQSGCTPTYRTLWERSPEVYTGWATWSGNVRIIGCLEHLRTLTPEEWHQARLAFEAAIRERDLSLIGSPWDGEMRAAVAAAVNAAVGRTVLTDWILEMSRGEDI